MRLLAIDFSDREARLIVAQSSADGVVLQDAFYVHQDESGGGLHAQVAAALAARRLQRVTTLVAVDRSQVELKHLALPPAPENELPELVRFQAMREFTTLDDDWPLDFLPLDEQDGSVNVLAATIEPAKVELIEKTCRDSSLKPKRLTIRPFATASLLQRCHPTTDRTIRLLVDTLGDEADLTVVIDGQAVFPRTVRLPGGKDSESGTAALITEIRRTMVAAQNQLGGIQTESILVCGTTQQHATLAQQIGRDLQIRTEIFDPLEGVRIEPQFEAEIRENSSRYAPLVGMLLDEVDGRRPPLDFLSPRRAPQKTSKRVKVGIVAGAAAALLALLAGWMYLELSWLDTEVTEARRGYKSKQAKAAAKAADKQIKDVASIRQWVDDDAIWLEELRRLSEDLPPAEMAMVKTLSLSSHQRGGRMALDILVAEDTQPEDVWATLRDGHREVHPRSDRPLDDHPRYKRNFTASVIVLNDKNAAAAAAKKDER